MSAPTSVLLVRAERAAHAITLSRLGDTAQVRRCRDAGFDLHLEKPCDIDQLAQAIGRLVSQARAAALG